MAPPAKSRYDTIALDKRHALAKRVEFYHKKWGLLCNPFWYPAYCGYKAEIEMDEKHQRIYKIAMTFMRAYEKVGRVFYMKPGDLERGLREHGFDEDFVKDGLALGVLAYYKGYIGLKEEFLRQML